jgi:hypothetical protein
LVPLASGHGWNTLGPMNLRLSLAALACVLASCASIEATTTQYLGVPRTAPTDAATVQVLPSEPMRTHDRLGEILLDVSVDPAPPVQDVEQRLREEAAKMGGNAVFVVRDVVNPNVGRKLIAVAIRYR